MDREVCGGTIERPRAGQLYCGARCRKLAERRRVADRKAAAFGAAFEANYGPMAEGPGDVAEVRRLLWTAARLGSVPAARILLQGLRRDEVERESDSIIGSIWRARITLVGVGFLGRRARSDRSGTERDRAPSRLEH